MHGRLAVTLGMLLAACVGQPDPPCCVLPPGGTIVFRNETTHAIDRISVDPSPAAVFHARNSAPIAPGATFAVEGLAPGAWDWLASIDAPVPGAVFHDLGLGVSLADGETVVVSLADAEFDGVFQVTNGGAADVTAVTVYVTPSMPLDSSQWLTAPLAPGASAVVPIGLHAGSYDVQCDFAGGGTFRATYAIQPITLTQVSCS